MLYSTEGNRILFEHEMKQAQLVGRASRFIMLATLGDEVIDCHCPVAGTIGGTRMDGLPCLVSGPYDSRATEWSFEAFSYFHPADPQFQWIGVNQTAANRYVEAALHAGWLDELFDRPVTTVRREVKLGSSRIDFLVNEDTYLEVKMPVDNIQMDVPEAIEKRWPMVGKVSKMDRAGRQAQDLSQAMREGKKAVFLTLFSYDNDGEWREWPYRKPKNAEERSSSPSAQAFKVAKSLGMDQWRLSLKLDPDGLTFLRLIQTPSW